MSPITESDTPQRLSRWIAVHIARYDDIAASRHLNVLHQDDKAAKFPSTATSESSKT